MYCKCKDGSSWCLFQWQALCWRRSTPSLLFAGFGGVIYRSVCCRDVICVVVESLTFGLFTEMRQSGEVLLGKSCSARRRCSRWDSGWPKIDQSYRIQ